MFKLTTLRLLMVLLALQICSLYGAGPNIPSKLLLAQEIIITDPDSKLIPDNPRSHHRIKIGSLYGTKFLSNNVINSIRPLLTDWLGHFRQTGQIQTITVRKEAFSYARPFYFNPFIHVEAIQKLADNFKLRLVMLVGGPQSGKTLSLRYLYELKRNIAPNKLSIFVDLPRIFNNFDPSSYKDLTINDILNNCVSDRLLDVVKHLLEVAPKRVTLLFDGVDQVPTLALDTILNIINKLAQNNIRVVTSSNFDISAHFKATSRYALRIVPIKNEMSATSLRTYMTEYWINKLATKNVQLDRQLVDDYYTVFEIITQNSPLPRNIATMEQLADYFSDASIIKSFPDVSEYALKSNIQRPQFLEMMQLAEKMHFPKLAFYDNYFQNFKPHEMEYYRSKSVTLLWQAVKHISYIEWKKPNELLIDNPHFLKELFLYNQDGEIINFVDNGYLYYFAAKQILTNFITSTTPYIETFFQVLVNPNLRFVAEYINEDVENVPALADAHSPLWEGIIQLFDETTTNLALNNLLKNGFDNLCSKIFEKIGLQRIDRYFSKFIESAVFDSKAEHKVFGMIPIVSYPPFKVVKNGYVRRKLFIAQGRSKYDVILKHNMVKTHNVASKLGFEWPVSYIIRHAAEKSPANFDSVLKKNIVYLQNHPDTLVQIGQELISKLGLKSIDLLRAINNLGIVSVASEACQYSLRTLAHAAVQRLDLNLLKEIDKESLLPRIDTLDRRGRTILLTALDSSPFLMWTPEEFWPMMEYLIHSSVDFLSANREQIKRIIHYRGKTVSSDTPSVPPDYKVLTSDDGQFDDNDIHLARTRFQCVPLHDWDLPAVLRYGRSDSVIKHASLYLSPELYPDDYVTVSEIIIKHRGLDALSERSQRAYENAIFEVIKKEMNDFKPNQMLRVFTNILENVQTHSELMRIKTMYVNDIYPNIPQSWYHEPSYHGKIDELFKLREMDEIIPDRLSNAPKIWGIKTSMEKNPILIQDESEIQLDADSNNIEITTELIQACIDKFLTF